MMIQRLTTALRVAITLSVTTGCLYLFARSAEKPVAYPSDYHDWTLIKRTEVPPSDSGFGKNPCESPCTGGVYRIYANEKAMAGYRTGKFPNGSIVADELLEKRASGDSAVDGPRRGVGVMVKDGRTYRDTGGWGFEIFGDADTATLDANGKASCYGCHKSRADRDMIFSEAPAAAGR